MHRPYSEADGSKFYQSLERALHRPLTFIPRHLPRLLKGSQPEKTSVHLVRIKPYHAPSATSATDFDSLDDLFLGIIIPLPDFDNTASQVRIGNLIVNAIENHKRTPGTQ